jgi:hypothetical protein
MARAGGGLLGRRTSPAVLNNGFLYTVRRDNRAETDARRAIFSRKTEPLAFVTHYARTLLLMH